MRRAAIAVAVLSVLPVAAALGAHPATAATSGYASVATTALLAGVRTDGTIGASGGLVPLDGGSARIVGSLDSSPSAHVLAAPYEPGGGARAVIGTVNTKAGQSVLDVPDAQADYPSNRQKASVSTVPPTTAGPVTVVGGAATAEVTATSATGTATGASYAVAGVLTAGGSTSDLAMSVDTASGTVVQTARAAVGSVSVAGVLELSDVVSQAGIRAAGDLHTAVQALTIGGARVSGQQVTIGNDGVTAVGMPLVPGHTVADATAQANAVLANAGVTVRTVGGAVKHDGRSAAADTGGVMITVRTPSVSGDVVTVVVGGVALTELDAPVVPLPDLGGLLPPVHAPVTSGGTTTTFVPGTPGLPGIPGGTGGSAMAGPQLAPTSYVLAGRRFTARTALVAFAVWQLLTLGIPTLYALVERRRRLAQLGRPA